MPCASTDSHEILKSINVKSVHPSSGLATCASSTPLGILHTSDVSRVICLKVTYPQCAFNTLHRNVRSKVRWKIWHGIKIVCLSLRGIMQHSSMIELNESRETVYTIDCSQIACSMYTSADRPRPAQHQHELGTQSFDQVRQHTSWTHCIHCDILLGHLQGQCLRCE